MSDNPFQAPASGEPQRFDPVASIDVDATVSVRRIHPLRAALIAAVLSASMTLLFLPFFALSLYAASQAPPPPGGGPNPSQVFVGMGLGFLVVVPVIYGVMGFVSGGLCALIYNLVAKMTGGIRVDLAQ